MTGNPGTLPPGRNGQQDAPEERMGISLGQAAYEAYVEDCGGKSIHGEPLPSWDGQSPEIRAHWEAAAEGVLGELTQYEH